jgi:hypothetical protein
MIEDSIREAREQAAQLGLRDSRFLTASSYLSDAEERVRLAAQDVQRALAALADAPEEISPDDVGMLTIGVTTPDPIRVEL